MTVGELIAKLQAFPAEKPVVLNTIAEDGRGFAEIKKADGMLLVPVKAEVVQFSDPEALIEGDEITGNPVKSICLDY